MKKELLNYVNKKDKKVVLLQSGGLDSLVCSALLSWTGFDVEEIFIDYGQSAVDNEFEMAQKICDEYEHNLNVVSLNMPWINTLPIVGGVVKSDGMESTVHNTIDAESYVPLRNTVFLSIAGSLAESMKYSYICAGLNGSQDMFGRPLYGFVDTHKNYAKSVENAINEGSSFKHKEHRSFELLTPLMGMQKKDVILLGKELNVDFSLSWSCYNAGDTPCLKCSSCLTRAEGFYQACSEDDLLREKGVYISPEKLFK